MVGTAADGEELTHAVAQVSVAASRDDTLPLLTGVRMEIDGEKVTLLATDRYRLALRELSWKPATPGYSSVALVRARTLSDAAKSLGGAGSVTVARHAIPRRVRPIRTARKISSTMAPSSIATSAAAMCLAASYPVTTMSGALPRSHSCSPNPTRVGRE